MVWHVDNKTAPLVKPRKQPVFSKETRYFTDEIGQTPTVPQADWFNMVQDELLQLAKALGVTPDKLNDGQIGPALAGKLQTINNLIPKVLDSLGDDRNNPASQRVVNDVNRDVVTAQKTANNAHALAQSKQDKLSFVGDGPDVMKTGAFGLGNTGANDAPINIQSGTSPVQFFNAHNTQNVPNQWGLSSSGSVGGWVVQKGSRPQAFFFGDSFKGLRTSRWTGSEWTEGVDFYTEINTSIDNSGFLRATGSKDAATTDQTICFGQKREDVTQNRSIGVEYKNTSSKPIFVRICFTYMGGNRGNASLSFNKDVTLSTHTETYSGEYSSIVLPGESYYIPTSANLSIKLWEEIK